MESGGPRVNTEMWLNQFPREAASEDPFFKLIIIQRNYILLVMFWNSNVSIDMLQAWRRLFGLIYFN